MLVLNEHKLTILFEEISQGFKHTPLEITLFIILVLGFISIFIIVYRYQLRKSRINMILQAQTIYNNIVRQKALSEFERNLLERLTTYLKSPYERNMLLENQSTFNACVKKLLMDEQIPSHHLSALRLKLGFKRQEPEQIPNSSVELTKDIPLLIIQRGGKECPGRFIKSNSDFLSIAIEKGISPPQSGDPIRIYFQKPSGLFYFSSLVKKANEGILRVAHSENIKRLQRRMYYRKKLKMPVYVRLSGTPDRPIRSIFTDLGGGGASLINTKRPFHEGDEIQLYFFASKEGRVNLPAKVIRISGGGKTLHVTFGNIPESIRDRIMGYLFKRK